MRVFMRSGVHRQVMARLPGWCDKAALVHWVQEASEPPSWAEAHRRLQEEGRRSPAWISASLGGNSLSCWCQQRRLRIPGLPWRPPLSSTRRLVRILGSVVQSLVLAMLNAGHDLAFGRA